MITWYKNQKISNKLVLGFLIISLIATIIGVVGIFNILSITKADTALYEENTLGLQYIGDVARNFERLRFNNVMLSLQENANDKQTYIEKVTDLVQTVDKALEQYKSTISDDEKTEEYNEVVSNWTKYKPLVDELIRLSNNRASQAEKLSLISSYKATGDDIRDALDNIVEYDSTQAEEKADHNSQKATRSLIIEIAVVIVAIILAITLGVYIAGLIGKPIVNAVRIAERLAVGDTDVKAMMDKTSLERRDEVGQLAIAFDKLIDATAEQVEATKRLATGDLTMDMIIRSEADQLGKSLQTLIGSLNDVASSIITASNQVAMGANQISNSSMALSQGATEQASSIEELTASIEQIAAQTSQNAQNAAKANELAENARRNAVNGDVQMSEMLKAMDEINTSSGNINKIIKVIDDIAFQTNILALNAAVEAARAGQHGKGFAVVAEEVRTLAAKSANAAKETTEMIEGSIRNVEAGIKIAKETADALKKIVTEVTNAAELVGSIAVSSSEQAQGIELLNQGIMQVSHVVQSNAAAAEEGAAASEELASQADQLKEVVSIFKTKQANVFQMPELSAAARLSENKPAAKASGSRAAKPNISLDDDFGKY
jgi:methyl-accepting chemotaxis protein